MHQNAFAAGTLLVELAVLPRPPRWIWGWGWERWNGKRGEKQTTGRRMEKGCMARVARPPKIHLISVFDAVVCKYTEG